jgi:hypothetical protein
MTYEPLQVADYYVGLFADRRDVYSAWTPSGWRPVREPLTPEIALAGLSGTGPSISGYMIAPGNTSHLLAMDFDTDNGWDQGIRLASFMATNGLPAYVETSRRGSHLWCILDAVAPAVAIRAAARGLMQSSGLPDDPHIEVRPGSDTIGEGGLGHALRLPTMPHPKTGKRGALHTPDGERLKGSLATILLEIEYASSPALLRWGDKWKRPPVKHLPAEYRAAGDYPEETSTASEILRELWGVQNAAPGRSVKCPAHEDKMPSLSILRDDRRAICKAGHCVLNNDDRGRGTHELRTLAPHG